MNTRLRKLRRTVWTVFLAMSVPAVSAGQSIWLPPVQESSVSLEVFKPDFSVTDQVEFLTTTWFLTGRYQKTKSIAFISEFPFSRYDAKQEEGENLIGNPYVGISYSPSSTGMILEGGIRLPLAKKDKPVASVVGWYSEFDRWESFIPDLLTVRARIGNWMRAPSGNIKTRLSVGGTVWIPTNEADAELFLDMVMNMWLPADRPLIGLTFSSRTLISESDLKLSSRSEFQAGFGLNVSFGKVHTGLHLHAPMGGSLTGFGDAIDVVYGLNTTFLLGE